MTWKPYSVEWDPSAARDLKNLDAKRRQSFIDAVQRYAETGRGDVKRLKGQETWRLRVGGWRVFFIPIASRHAIAVSGVSPRGDAYK